MDNLRDYLILHDAIINTNNNITSRYNIYILLSIIFLLLIIICYLVNKIGEMNIEQNRLLFQNQTQYHNQFQNKFQNQVQNQLSSNNGRRN